YDQQFRQDLLYRINTVEIRLPSLKERIEDIPLLTEHFLKLYKRKYQKPKLSIEKGVIEKLSRYQWPGNIRELQHAIERAVILSDQDIISTVDLLINNAAPVKLEQGKAKTLDEAERDFILASLEANKGNVTKTAEILGLTRTALYRRMSKHGI
ncbi:MAG: helix-turn-helix domain-containing protein, partial [Bacteroidota bacterium]